MAIIPDGTAFANHGVLVVESQDNSAVFNWRNTIDVAWATGSEPAYGDAVISAFVNFLKGIQRDDCSIVKVSLFPYVKGRQPLSLQGAIFEQIVSIACKDWGTGTAHPPATSSLTAPVGELCVLMVKGKFGGPSGGRIGRMFLRNAVPQEALKNVAGGPPELDPTLSGTTVAEWNAWSNTNLAPFCEGASLPKFILVHASKHGVPAGSHDIFDSQMSPPQFQKLAMHNISSKSRK